MKYLVNSGHGAGEQAILAPHATPILLYGHLSQQLCQFAICQMANHPQSRNTLLGLARCGHEKITLPDIMVNFSCTISYLCCFMVLNQKSSVAQNMSCSASAVNHSQRGLSACECVLLLGSVALLSACPCRCCCLWEPCEGFRGWGVGASVHIMCAGGVVLGRVP